MKIELKKTEPRTKKVLAIDALEDKDIEVLSSRLRLINGVDRMFFVEPDSDLISALTSTTTRDMYSKEGADGDHLLYEDLVDETMQVMSILVLKHSPTHVVIRNSGLFCFKVAELLEKRGIKTLAKFGDRWRYVPSIEDVKIN